MIVYLITQLVMGIFFPDQGKDPVERTGVIIKPVDGTVKGGHHPFLKIENFTDAELVLPNRCPNAPVDVAIKQGGEFVLLEATDTALPCEAVAAIAPGDKLTVDLAPWKYSLFSEYGEYQVSIPEELEVESEPTTLTLYEQGSITNVFRTFVTRPMLNLLVLIASKMPGYNLGIAIIILTVLIKLLLFFPTQHAMEGQKKMQAVQPELDAVKKKYKQDPKKLQEETMRIWKENGVNPMQSCLPILIQFPILIGLFFVIRDGSVLELSRHLLYNSHLNLPWSFGTQFLGLDLLVPSKLVFPPLLVITQFLQMKLSFAIAKKKKKDTKKKSKQQQSAQDMQQKVMLYGLPIMIGVFAFQFPAAVSLYWFVSTVFAVGQQVVVNRKV